MLNGVGMLSSQRINLTTLSMPVRQITHAPTAVELTPLLPDVDVRVCCAYLVLLPLAMHCCRSSTAILLDSHPLAIAPNSPRWTFLLIRAEDDLH
jgi:hypothetical protein